MSRSVSPVPKFTSTTPLPQQLSEDSVDRVNRMASSQVGQTLQIQTSFPSLVSGSFPSAQFSSPPSSPSAVLLGQGQLGIPPAVRPLQPQPSFIVDSFEAQTLSAAQLNGTLRAASPTSTRQAPVGRPVAPPTDTQPGSFSQPIRITVAQPTQREAPPTVSGSFAPNTSTQRQQPLGSFAPMMAPPTQPTLRPVGPPVALPTDPGSMAAFVPGSMAPLKTLHAPSVASFGEQQTLASGRVSQMMVTSAPLAPFNDPFYDAEFASSQGHLMATSYHNEMPMQVPPTLGYSHRAAPVELSYHNEMPMQVPPTMGYSHRAAPVELHDYHDDHFTHSVEVGVHKTGDAGTAGIGARCCMCCANIFACCSSCLVRKSVNAGSDQGDSGVMFLVCGYFGIVMLILIPVWDGVSLLNDPAWMYMNGSTLPIVLICCAAAIPVLFLVTVTLLLNCGHRGSGARTEQTMFGAALLFILLLGTILVVLSEPLKQQAAWGKSEFVNCETGVKSSSLYMEYQALQKMRNSTACAKEASVEACSGFETTSQSRVLQQFEQSMQCTGFCYHPKVCKTKNCYPQALFTNLRLMGSCSAMAARNMESFVNDMSKQLMFEGFFLIAASIIQGFLALFGQMGKTGLRKGRGYGTIQAPVEVVSEFITYNGDMRRRQKI